MPHRHLLRWRTGPLCVEFEVEALTDGVIFYAADPEVTGGAGVPPPAAREAEAWLRSRFRHVIVDHSPKAKFRSHSEQSE